MFVVVMLLASRRAALDAEPEPWCFISKRYPIWRLAALYLPLFLSWILTTVLYVTARRELAKATHKSSHYSKFIAIPLCFVLLRVWGAVYRLAELSAYDPETHSSLYWLLIMTSLGDPSQGTVNCLVFVLLSTSVREKITLWFHERRHGALDAKPLLGTNTEPADVGNSYRRSGPIMIRVALSSNPDAMTAASIDVAATPVSK